MEQRPADRGAGRVERRGHRVERRLEGEDGDDDLDRVVDALADRAGGDQREEGDRQGDHEGEQGDRAHLARRRPERRPGRRRAPRRRRGSPASQRPNRLHCRGTKICSPASISSVTTRPTPTPSTTFSPSSAERRDEAAGQPREGVLLALERQRAGDQEDGDEGQGQGRGDGDREDVERRRGAVDDLLLDLDRLRQAVDQRRGDVEVFAGQRAKRITRSSESRSGPGGSAGRSASRICAGRLQAEDLDRLAERPRSRRRRSAG